MIPPGASGLALLEIFTGNKSCINRIQDFHPFVCPIFVLDPSLQQGHKIPCWRPQSRVGVYLGLSPLVLSTTSSLVSPQFNVVYDDNFTTTQFLQMNQLPNNWANLLTTSIANNVDDSFLTLKFTNESRSQSSNGDNNSPSHHTPSWDDSQ